MNFDRAASPFFQSLNLAKPIMAFLQNDFLQQNPNISPQDNLLQNNRPQKNQQHNQRFSPRLCLDQERIKNRSVF